MYLLLKMYKININNCSDMLGYSQTKLIIQKSQKSYVNQSIAGAGRIAITNASWMGQSDIKLKVSFCAPFS